MTETPWTRAVRYRRSLIVPASKPDPIPDDPFSEGVRQTLAIIEDHWPVGDDQCVCGWDSAWGTVGWYQHLDNAVDEAIGA